MGGSGHGGSGGIRGEGGSGGGYPATDSCGWSIFSCPERNKATLNIWLAITMYV